MMRSCGFALRRQQLKDSAKRTPSLFQIETGCEVSHARQASLYTPFGSGPCLAGLSKLGKAHPDLHFRWRCTGVPAGGFPRFGNCLQDIANNTEGVAQRFHGRLNPRGGNRVADLPIFPGRSLNATSTREPPISKRAVTCEVPFASQISLASE